MSYVFKYLTAPRPNLEPAKGPYLSITLHGKDGKILNTLALLDSGADTCAMPKSAAEILGLDLETAKESSIWTASGSIIAKRVDVDITIHLAHEKKTIRAPFNVLMCSSNYEPPIMLGRVGFFDNFYITFNEREKSHGKNF